MVTVTKRAAAMAMSVAGKDAGDGKGRKSNGDGAKRAIARRMAMAGPINKINKILHQCPRPTHCKEVATRGWLLIQ
jgi:hypothetical protein